MTKLFSEGYQSPEKLEKMMPCSYDGEIVIYQPEDGNVKLEVHIDDETVWLSQQQMAQLFAIGFCDWSYNLTVLSSFPETQTRPCLSRNRLRIWDVYSENLS